MGAKTKTRSNGEQRLAGILVGLVCLFAALGCDLSVIGLGSAPLPTDLPTATLRPTQGQSTAFFVNSTQPATSTPLVSPTARPRILYYTQSGDTLDAIATRFGVDKSSLLASSPDPIKPTGFLPPNQLLLVPNLLDETGPATILLPDSEIVNSPSVLDFDLKGYVKQAGGHLNGYTEYLATGLLTGADVVQMVATDQSINPRILLALLEYQSHWVTGQPGNLAEEVYPLGFLDVNSQKLFAQLSWAARQLDLGYYGWRSGKLTQVTFPDGTSLHLAPELNAGSAAIEYFFANFLNRREWAGALSPTGGFLALYEKMFGPVQARAEAVEPLFPPNIAQPVLDLPFFPGQVWSFSGGPHSIWGKDTPFAALDFAPGSTEPGCVPSPEYVLAPAAGLVIRSANGLVALDLDGDGHEQTGWVLIFLHIRSDGKVDVGQRLNKDDPIGHPSCEGGTATGTHFHFARKYNGEWILADGPLPFVIGGWTAHAGLIEYQGTLTKDGKTITAATNGSAETQIIRPKVPGP